MHLALQDLYSPSLVNKVATFWRRAFYFSFHECTGPQYTVSVVFHIFTLWHPMFYEGILAGFTKKAGEVCDLLGYDAALEEQNR